MHPLAVRIKYYCNYCCRINGLRVHPRPLLACAESKTGVSPPLKPPLCVHVLYMFHVPVVTLRRPMCQVRAWIPLMANLHGNIGTVT